MFNDSVANLREVFVPTRVIEVKKNRKCGQPCHFIEVSGKQLLFLYIEKKRVF